jgi:hypothetical protein
MSKELEDAEKELKKAVAENDEQLESAPEAGEEPEEAGDDYTEDAEPAETDDYTEDSDSDEEASEDDDGERSKKREKRRRHREYKKQKERELKLKLAQERAEKEEIAMRLQAVENRQLSSSYNNLENDIKKGLKAIDIAKQAMAKAERENNGVQYAKAHAILNEAEEFIRSREDLRDQIVKSAQQRAAGGAMTTTPQLKKYADVWLSRNKDWFDRSNPSVEAAVLAIDAQVMNEGYNPNTPAYWKELEGRCRTIFSKEKAKKAKPKGPGASSSGDSSRDETGSLDRQFVTILKQQGIWDDPKLRKTAIEDYKKRAKEKS